MAMGDVDDDGMLRPDRRRRQGPRARSRRLCWRVKTRQRLLRDRAGALPALRSDARGGVSVAASQIDGQRPTISSSDRARHPERGEGLSPVAAAQARHGPALFAAFRPYGDDRSGVSIATGFVDFSTGRNSIVTAPGPGGTAEVKVFVFPLLSPVGLDGTAMVPCTRAGQTSR